jgi:hypothetical protein
MFVVVNKYILAKGFDGIVLWPFLFVKRKELKEDPVFMNHERIHVKQQKELLVIFFFVWYVVEYFVRLIRYKDTYKAYSKICFEREAYAHEDDPEYMETRTFWSFLKFL